MRTRATATAAAVGVLLAVLTACGETEEKKADAGACKAAVAKVLEDSASDGKLKDGERPKGCEGLSDKELEKITKDAAQEFLDKKKKEFTEDLKKDADKLVDQGTGAGEDVGKELDDALKELEKATSAPNP
ncbi:hypothetical protein [Streptomyces clavuligerus]|uniref:Secreted protein n=1 Tax=Streptomyces clavuligerus TaxID=1901 RepID=E2PXW0_STRCL|nr:hypothetical protein [Streptomyces clavuligerus]ANW19067.1 hypothetical protein BB341_12940 [Streptomyces clavuligerus]AXU13650.1 hypothetical protein D1794_13415 [Streptomyces clavuligerus]EFG08200.1 Hypothetical protein SCLAV_3129 [Streptomyces clavuligerus]MBY6303618.1 hypothetical protein [Streptomyces clavuligerus]QCS06434.1 hypothetical protein CRV15_12850 [Streptomyces clavuligerus]